MLRESKLEVHIDRNHYTFNTYLENSIKTVIDIKQIVVKDVFQIVSIKLRHVILISICKMLTMLEREILNVLAVIGISVKLENCSVLHN